MTRDPAFLRPLVVLESPLMGRPAAWWPRPLRRVVGWWLMRRNLAYAARCMLDSIQRDEAPFASHLLYTRRGVLRDRVMRERAIGLYCGFAWGARAALRAVYCDYGISEGMRIGITQRPHGQPVVYRYIHTPHWAIPTCEMCGESAPPGGKRCGGLGCRSHN